MTTEIEQDALSFKIGAVARITGIPADTLRMWERRYTVVSPRRGQGSSRLYSREDITRLTLIKQLVDRGSAISTVANLSREQLLEQLDLMQGGDRNYADSDNTEQTCRIMICGDALPLKMSGEANDYAGIEILGAYASMAEFEIQAAAQQPDIIVLEYPALMPETVSEIRTQLRRSGAKKAIVIYGFATREVVRSLHGGNTIPLRAPVDAIQLRQQCRQALFDSRQHGHDDDSEFSDEIPARLFNADELAQLVQASTTVMCECPHHLVDIIQRLSSFEAYSAECENRGPEDAALHAYLHGATARVRSTMEKALERVARAEGIDLANLQARATAGES